MVSIFAHILFAAILGLSMKSRDVPNPSPPKEVVPVERKHTVPVPAPAPEPPVKKTPPAS